MKILVTGSSGFIGFHLVRKLLAMGHFVVGIDDHNDYYDVSLKTKRKNLLQAENFKFIESDINDINCSENNFDIAINLAAQAGVRVPEQRAYLYEHTNIKGFKKFCSFCMNKDIKKIIYASSSSVYCDQNKEKFSESKTELKPKSDYGLSKLQNEQFASTLTNEENVSMVGLRFFSVYGPYGRPDMAYFSFVESIRRGEEIILFNKGKMLRDMTYIDDIVNGLVLTLAFIKKSNPKNEIFNLGNNTPIKTIELLKIIERQLKIKAKIKNKNIFNESEFTHADISKAIKILGYKPKISIEAGIEKFIKWHYEYKK